MTRTTVGSGIVTQLGWDWTNAAPLGTQDGGWNAVLRRAVTDAVAYTPTASTTANGVLSVHGTDVDDVITVASKKVSSQWRVLVTVNGRTGIRTDRDAGAAAAFRSMTERAYVDVDADDKIGLRGVPYVCLRVPTGGGKTIIGAHAVGQIAQRLLREDAPLCLWVTPSTTIRDQALRGLRDPEHPYGDALRANVPQRHVDVLTIEEALQCGYAFRPGNATIIVTTIQSYRIDDLDVARKVYADNGYPKRARDLRRCIANTIAGQRCRAFACWGDTRCTRHGGAKRVRTPTCTCVAYAWPHRPGGDCAAGPTRRHTAGPRKPARTRGDAARDSAASLR